MSVKNIIQAVFNQLIGLIFYGLGIAGIVIAGLGASPIDAFSYYLNKLVPAINQGYWLAIVNLTIAIILFIILKKIRLIFSIGIALITGIFVNLGLIIFRQVLNLNSTELISNIYVAILVASIGIIMMAFGIAWMIVNNSLVSPYDELSIYLQTLTNNYALSKMILDGTFLILAIIVGLIYGKVFEQINVFSIVVVLGLGPLINIFVKLFKKEVKAWN